MFFSILFLDFVLFPNCHLFVINMIHCIMLIYYYLFDIIGGIIIILQTANEMSLLYCALPSVLSFVHEIGINLYVLINFYLKYNKENLCSNVEHQEVCFTISTDTVND